MSSLSYPFNSSEILKRKKSLKRQLSEHSGLFGKRIAILSGSTIGDIKDILEIFLLDYGIKPQFYVGQYNRFYEDAMFENKELAAFEPELIYIHTTAINLSDNMLIDKLQAVWDKIAADYSCPIIQNNFELPFWGIDVERKYVNYLNIKLADHEKENHNFYVNDIQSLSAFFGLDNWFNQQEYFLYKYALSVGAIPALCHNIAKTIKSIYGRNQKCLVLDLDNTLWGGVVGDVGTLGIELGVETALGEAYVTFQKYVKTLYERGILLAVCSKNEESIAKEAFSNPNMLLKLEDFAVFCANWDTKAENVLRISKQINILPESIVFVDDNQAERELVKQELPEVKIVEANSVIDFIRHIELGGYFYSPRISEDDKKRNEYYSADVKRSEVKDLFIDYGEYLRSLEMTSAILPFATPHLDRITQLINKTNQFNLTTKRYSQSEIEAIASNPGFITLYATLDDKFGSNGIVSVLIGEIIEQAVHIRLWVMSCRVFKRDLELAVFDHFVEICKTRGLKELIGYYFITEKNKYVSGLFGDLGFDRIENDIWKFALTADYKTKSKYIKLKGGNRDGYFS